ncbi:ThiF family adenylyltransferase [Desulfovibrio psychrotolerans]|uniref:THIF-type NAD/FAD binding fold domain-containing protein n=1 Tax=Desulfovibrio psychrotolerans TaxID=415242 RepID=A0A7J0BQ44_9BACT|nr:ThiF family adenylyltransferase [Desulfovibrio psychrotolerans]GFM35758.1 hypothetical protein DSM19430T_04420 [Desulfovibrio psychrotolerans]
MTAESDTPDMRPTVQPDMQSGKQSGMQPDMKSGMKSGGQAEAMRAAVFAVSVPLPGCEDEASAVQGGDRACASPERTGQEHGPVRRIITMEALNALGVRHGWTARQLERQALRSGVMPERYVRNANHLDCAQQLCLLDAHVLLVGLGGLGGYVLELLARMGVGTITGADGDAFVPSNLNRQLLSDESRLHVPKAQAAADRVAVINSAVTFIPLCEYLSGERMRALCRGKTLVVDALGGLQYRLELQQAAAQAGVPMVTAAVGGLSGYVAVVMPGETGPAELLGTGGAAEDVLGTPAPVVACAAALQCAEIMRLITGKHQAGGQGAPHAGAERDRGILFFDLADRTFQNVRLG